MTSHCETSDSTRVFVPHRRAGELPGVSAPKRLALCPSDLAHLIIEGLLSLVFPDPHARQRLGLKAISRCRRETPAWYIWTTAHHGAFEVAFLPGAADQPDGALLALRYFPEPGEAVFTRFSPLEQQARLSPLFDATGTPATDSSDQLDPSLFHVGSLTIFPQGESHVGLCLAAQEKWIEHVRYQDDGDWRIRRDVPGLSLALAVLDPLVCGLSYLGRQPPARVRAWRRPGLAWYIEPDGSAVSDSAADAAEWRIEMTGLRVPGCSGAPAPAQDITRASQKPLFEYAAEIPPHYAPWPISEQWWQAAGWQFDPVGEFCSHCATEADEDKAHCHTTHAEQ